MAELYETEVGYITWMTKLETCQEPVGIGGVGCSQLGRWGHANLVMELGYLSLLKVMNIVIHTSKSKVYASPIHSSLGG